MTSFTPLEAETLQNIILKRRDVRGNHFVNSPIAEVVLEKILLAGVHAPSVGYSQPWEFVVIKDRGTKQQIVESFAQENHIAADQFESDKQALYHQLKLEGILEAPVNIAVFYKPSKQPVLGQNSMPEMGAYSVVCAIQNMWLMSRALNVGLGWVSILDPQKVKQILNAPESHQLVGYLCLGYVDEFLEQPELKTVNWADFKALEQCLIHECYANQPAELGKEICQAALD